MSAPLLLHGFEFTRQSDGGVQIRATQPLATLTLPEFAAVVARMSLRSEGGELIEQEAQQDASLVLRIRAEREIGAEDLGAAARRVARAKESKA